MKYNVKCSIDCWSCMDIWFVGVNDKVSYLSMCRFWMTPVFKFGTEKRAYGRYEKMLAKDSLNVERTGAVV